MRMMTLIQDSRLDNYRKSRRLDNKILEYPETIIGANTSIGAAAVILPGIRIGKNVTIAAQLQTIYSQDFC